MKKRLMLVVGLLLVGSLFVNCSNSGGKTYPISTPTATLTFPDICEGDWMFVGNTGAFIGFRGNQCWFYSENSFAFPFYYDGYLKQITFGYSQTPSPYYGQTIPLWTNIIIIDRNTWTMIDSATGTTYRMVRV